MAKYIIFSQKVSNSILQADLIQRTQIFDPACSSAEEAIVGKKKV